ncbi:hypothetical protein Bpfe_018364 [Biomphalaria pfeifferi]|uniref:Uncharacterized protein n=1 Tax=Biomphalaria pfeifferi TaxID=112525 RepID=A0AAD8F6N2_BIOPF|nr:hypothetical protein Bpfe_018364 [Biomphalaria pfeifferi]
MCFVFKLRKGAKATSHHPEYRQERQENARALKTSGIHYADNARGRQNDSRYPHEAENSRDRVNKAMNPQILKQQEMKLL